MHSTKLCGADNDAHAVGDMKLCSLQVNAPMARLAPLTVPGFSVTLQRSPARARSRTTMPNADLDLWVSRAHCVCSDSLLLLISSTDAAETQLEAAFHRPRARAAASRVVGVAQTLPFASPALLLVLLRGGCGALGGLGALCDARLGVDVRLFVRSNRVLCQYCTRTRWILL